MCNIPPQAAGMLQHIMHALVKAVKTICPLQSLPNACSCDCHTKQRVPTQEHVCNIFNILSQKSIYVPTFMDMKLAPLSLATALATSVLPHPGGPYRSTPVGSARPSAAKRSGCLIGSVMENASSSRTYQHQRLGMRNLLNKEFWQRKSQKCLSAF